MEITNKSLSLLVCFCQIVTTLLVFAWWLFVALRTTLWGDDCGLPVCGLWAWAIPWIPLIVTASAFVRLKAGQEKQVVIQEVTSPLILTC